jgi:hypothetical protein
VERLTGTSPLAASAGSSAHPGISERMRTLPADGRSSACSWGQSFWAQGWSASSSQAERTTSRGRPATVRRPGGATALESHRVVLAERAELGAQLQRLGPACGQLRAVLNEVNRVLGQT